MKWNLNLKSILKQDFSKWLEHKKEWFSFSNGSWRFTLPSHRFYDCFNNLLQQMKQPYFFSKYVCIYTQIL